MSYFSSDEPLEEFYLALADEDSERLRRVHIPRSDVFYVREALFQRTGFRYSLDRIERALFVEGFLNATDVLDPERVREFDDGHSY